MKGGSIITMAEPKEDGLRWEFVPENLWEHYEKSLESKNPVEEAEFWRMVAEHHIKVIIGYDIDEYEKAIPKAMRDFRQCADAIKKVAKDTGIARTTGGVAGIAGVLHSWVACLLP